MRIAWFAVFALAGCGRLAFDPLGDVGIADGGETTSDGLPPVASHGHFVEIPITTGMNFGGIAAANNFCLTTLMNRDWLGKAEALAAGQLTGARVKAWLCTTAACQNLQPNQWYRYSSAVNTTRGGAMFTATAQGYLEDDGRAFGDDMVFGNDAGFADYFTGRASNNQPQSTTCSDWTATTGTTLVAVNDTADYSERLAKYSEACDFVSNIICFVDP